MRRVRWLLFDVGGVLETADDDRWPGEFVARWAGHLGLGVEEFEARVETAGLPDASTRSGVEDEFWQRYGAAVGADAHALAAMREDFWDAYCGEANTPLLDFVRGLDARVGRAILSNSGDGARREEERRFGFSEIFDPICYSHEIGVNKPDPGAFHVALSAMAAAPRDVVFVDNLQANIDAARQLGITGVLHVDNASTTAAITALLSRGAG